MAGEVLIGGYQGLRQGEQWPGRTVCLMGLLPSSLHCLCSGLSSMAMLTDIWNTIFCIYTVHTVLLRKFALLWQFVVRASTNNNRFYSQARKSTLSSKIYLINNDFFSVTLLGFCLVWRKIEQNNSISQIVCMVWCYNLESLSKKAAKFEKDEKSKSVY